MKHPYVEKHFQKHDDKKRRSDYQARTYHRLLTGLQIARNQNLFGRFMTLTSSFQSINPIKHSFDILRTRIERATYEKDGFQGFKFNRYYCLRTAEARPYQKNRTLGVLHIIYWGQYIPYDWLVEQWKDIHQAFKVTIQACFTKRRKVDGLVNYLLTNYLSDQPIVRMSYGWKWAWLGFCKSWKKYKQIYKRMKCTPRKYALLGFRIPLKLYAQFGLPTFNRSNQVMSAWHKILHTPPPTSRQKKLMKKSISIYEEKQIQQKKDKIIEKRKRDYEIIELKQRLSQKSIFPYTKINQLSQTVLPSFF